MKKFFRILLTVLVFTFVVMPVAAQRDLFAEEICIPEVLVEELFHHNLSPTFFANEFSLAGDVMVLDFYVLHLESEVAPFNGFLNRFNDPTGKISGASDFWRYFFVPVTYVEEDVCMSRHDYDIAQFLHGLAIGAMKYGYPPQPKFWEGRG